MPLPRLVLSLVCFALCTGQYQASNPPAVSHSAHIMCYNDSARVFVARKGGRCSMNYEEAVSACHELDGARIATRAEVEQAQSDGLTCRLCGWVEEREAVYLMDVEQEECGGIGVNECGSRDADVFCYSVDLRDIVCKNNLANVFHLRKEGRYAMNYEQAKDACIEAGARIATRAEVEEARSDGRLTCCLCGWVAERETVYPMNVNFVGCHGVGLNGCGRGNADAYCYDDEGDTYASGGSGTVMCKNDLTQVFHLRKGNQYSLTYANAKAACQDFGARMATRAEMDEAYSAGLTCCICGWVQGEGDHPVNVEIGCQNPGVSLCRPRDSDVYCYPQ